VSTKYLIDTLNPTGYSQVLDELVSGAVTKIYTYGLQRISENQLSGSTWTPTFYGYDVTCSLFSSQGRIRGGHL
jgi:hypothetical protein